MNSSKKLVKGIVRNATSLMVIGIFGKGMGLIIAVLVARFLGPEATGLFAFLFSIAILVESFVALGLQEMLVREVAANPDHRRALFLLALKLVIPFSLLASSGYLIAAFFVTDLEGAQNSLFVLAFSTPFAVGFLVAQAALQGAERMRLLTSVIVSTRLVSIAFLALLLFFGANVEAAFASRFLFHMVSFIGFFIVLLRAPAGNSGGLGSMALLRRSLPFALNRSTYDLGARAPVLMLPALLGLATTGIFDAADRFRHTLAMTVTSAMTGLMPAFAREFGGEKDNDHRLLGFSTKYSCLFVSAIATVASVGASYIIQILYGQAFLASAQPMQILLWSHVIVATDATLKQAMLAAQSGYAVVSRSVVGLLCQLMLIFTGGHLFGLLGVCAAVFVSSLLVLILDLRYVTSKLMPLPIGQFIVRPLIGSLLVGVALLLVPERELLLRCGVAIVAWILVLLLFRIVPKEEFHFFKDIYRAVLGKFRKKT